MNRLTNSLYLAGGMLIGCLAIITGLITGGGTTAHAQAAAAQKPNIVEGTASGVAENKLDRAQCGCIEVGEVRSLR